MESFLRAVPSGTAWRRIIAANEREHRAEAAVERLKGARPPKDAPKISGGIRVRRREASRAAY